MKITLTNRWFTIDDLVKYQSYFPYATQRYIDHVLDFVSYWQSDISLVELFKNNLALNGFIDINGTAYNPTQDSESLAKVLDDVRTNLGDINIGLLEFQYHLGDDNISYMTWKTNKGNTGTDQIYLADGQQSHDSNYISIFNLSVPPV